LDMGSHHTCSHDKNVLLPLARAELMLKKPFWHGDDWLGEQLELTYELHRALDIRTAPELFPRADGTLVCAISTIGALRSILTMLWADKSADLRLEALCWNISPALAAAPIKARQACFRPVTEDGLPVSGAVAGVDGAYVATGHSVWGMLNAPATGEAMGELNMDGEAGRVDLAPFAPGRLPPLDPARLRGASG
jgi:glycine/D-amino acid oxidase-like deaminating enzyme